MLIINYTELLQMGSNYKFVNNTCILIKFYISSYYVRKAKAKEELHFISQGYWFRSIAFVLKQR